MGSPAEAYAVPMAEPVDGYGVPAMQMHNVAAQQPQWPVLNSVRFYVAQMCKQPQTHASLFRWVCLSRVHTGTHSSCRQAIGWPEAMPIRLCNAAGEISVFVYEIHTSIDLSVKQTYG